MNIAPVQKAEGLARKHGRTMYVYANPDPSRRAARRPYIISDVEPPAAVWPMTAVHPDGTTTRRPHHSHVHGGIQVEFDSGN